MPSEIIDWNAPSLQGRSPKLPKDLPHGLIVPPQEVRDQIAGLGACPRIRPCLALGPWVPTGPWPFRPRPRPRRALSPSTLGGAGVAPNLQQIVGQADQLPLGGDFLQAP